MSVPPNADLLFTGDSIIVHEYVDNTLVTVEGMIRASAKLYAGEFELTNPLNLAPVWRLLTGFSADLLGVGHQRLYCSVTR